MERGLVWDMNSQVAAWLKSNEARTRCAATRQGVRLGYSQTGGFLNTYVNAIHPLANDANGKPIYDGYFITVAAGLRRLVPINGSVGTTPRVNDARRDTGNVGVPVIRTMSQSDYVSGIAGPAGGQRRAAGPLPPLRDGGRGPRVAVRAHYSARPATSSRPGRRCRRSRATRARAAASRPVSLFDAMLQNLDAWVRNGTPPPARPTDPARATTQPVRRRARQRRRRRPLAVRRRADEHLVRQHHRCVVLLHRRLRASRSLPAKLAQLYPTKADYVAKVTASGGRWSPQRYLTEADERDIMQEAHFACTPGPSHRSAAADLLDRRRRRRQRHGAGDAVADARAEHRTSVRSRPA